MRYKRIIFLSFSLSFSFAINMDCKKAATLVDQCSEAAEALAKEAERTRTGNDEFEGLMQRVESVVNQALVVGDEQEGKETTSTTTKGRELSQEELQRETECRARLGELIELNEALEAGVRRVVQSKGDEEQKKEEKESQPTLETLETQLDGLETTLESLAVVRGAEQKEASEVEALLKTSQPSCPHKTTLPPALLGPSRILSAGLALPGPGGDAVLLQLLHDILNILSREIALEGDEGESAAVMLQTIIDRLLRSASIGSLPGSLPSPLDLPDSTVEWLARHRLLKSLDMICRNLKGENC